MLGLLATLDLTSTQYPFLTQQLAAGLLSTEGSVTDENSQDSAGLATSSSAASVPVVSADLNETGEVNSSDRGASDG